MLRHIKLRKETFDELMLAMGTGKKGAGTKKQSSPIIQMALDLEPQQSMVTHLPPATFNRLRAKNQDAHYEVRAGSLIVGPDVLPLRATLVTRLR